MNKLITINSILKNINRLQLNINKSVSIQQQSIKTNQFNKFYTTNSKISENHASNIINKLRKSPCWSCNEHIEKKKVFCPMCNKVQKPDESVDVFYLFDIKPQFKVDLKDLSHRFKNLQKQLHPDLFEQKNDKEKALSKEISTSINTAYNILKSPFLRAEYILNQKGLDLSSVGDVDPEVLMEVLEVREQIDEGSTEEITKIGHENRSKIDEVSKELETLFEKKDYQEALKKTVYLRYLTRIQEEIHKKLEVHI